MRINIKRTGGQLCEQQSEIGVQVGLPDEIEIKVVCSSVGRDTTMYQIFDERGENMGSRRFNCGMGPIVESLNSYLVDDLNVLLEEFAMRLTNEEFSPAAGEVVSICERKYGNGIEGGDCIITIK